MLYRGAMDDHKSKWIIEGISPQAMEKAILAAAGAGLSLADWLDLRSPPKKKKIVGKTKKIKKQINTQVI